MVNQLSTGETRTVGPRVKALRLADFKMLKIIGRGAFGEVFIAQRRGSAAPGAAATPVTPGVLGANELCAIKCMRKSEMLKKKQVLHVRSERNVLAETAASCPWITKLFYSFEDDDSLVMAMEYMPGGDLMTWLCDLEVFTTDATRFYVAEMCLAVHAVHSMRYVHRDIKPDNVLLDASGHLKLSDFGLCKAFDEAASQVAPDSVDLYGTAGDASTSPIDERAADGSPDAQRRMFKSVVGSPGYIAPEILLAQPYGVGCDWWSVGIIMYEMLYGCPPFYANDNAATCHKITHWAEHLAFPDASRCRYPVGPDAVDLLRRLLCDQGDRIGFEGIRAHPFFAGIDWENIRSTPAAFQPRFTSAVDTRYFPKIDVAPRRVPDASDEALAMEDPRGVLFVGFNYNGDSRKQRHQHGEPF
jgi:serine/threonine protein kinase